MIFSLLNYYIRIKISCFVDMFRAHSKLLDECGPKIVLALVHMQNIASSREQLTAWNSWQVLSCVPPDYLSRQTDLNHTMRAIVVEWIVKVFPETKSYNFLNDCRLLIFILIKTDFH